jgi:hypothetical protein
LFYRVIKETWTDGVKVDQRIADTFDSLRSALIDPPEDAHQWHQDGDTTLIYWWESSDDDQTWTRCGAPREEFPAPLAPKYRVTRRRRRVGFDDQLRVVGIFTSVEEVQQLAVSAFQNRHYGVSYLTYFWECAVEDDWSLCLDPRLPDALSDYAESHPGQSLENALEG